MTGEIALVFYTVLSQAAIGLFGMLTMETVVAGISEQNHKTYRNGYFIVCAITCCAMLVSLLHLGSPLRALNSLRHLSTSWLSREILLTGCFLGFAGLCWLLSLKNKHLLALGIAGAAAGLACVFAQSSIYAGALIPAWGYGHSYVTFFGAALSMGGAFGMLFANAKEENRNAKCLVIGFMAVLTGFVIQAVFYSFFAGTLPSAGSAGVASAKLLKDFGGLMVLRWIAPVMGIAAMGCSLLTKKNVKTAILAGLILIVAGELISRYVFYGIGVMIGIG